MSDMSMNNPALDNKVTTINPKGRGGWVMATVVCLTLWEGFAPVGHHDPIDPRGVNTIGFGHIENVQIGDRVTKVQAQQMLAQDLPRYEAQVERCIHVAMPGYRHAAILSFDYNVGGGALCKSSVARYINAGEPNKGCDALMLYVKSNGKFRQGLQNRRAAERKMCLNSNEPPVLDPVVMKEGRKNVDQASAIKEAAAIVLPTVAKPVPMKGIVVTPAPASAPVAPASWSTRLGRWFMEK